MDHSVVDGYLFIDRCQIIWTDNATLLCIIWRIAMFYVYNEALCNCFMFLNRCNGWVELVRYLCIIFLSTLDEELSLPWPTDEILMIHIDSTIDKTIDA